MRTKQTRLVIAAAALWTGASILPAQTTAPKAGDADKSNDDELIVLSPFEVSTTSESDAYQVKDTLAGTRVRTNLNDLGTAITVVSKKFMQDIGATDAQSLLQYTTNSEVGGLYGNFGGMGNNSTISENQRLLQPNTFTRVRGLAAADSTRNYFLSSIPWDNFNVDRVDMQRGPNSMLFGTGSPAGIINTSLNDAMYKSAYKAQNRFDEYGSLRYSLDLNQVIIDRKLAVRLVGLDDNAKYRQDGTFNHQKRIYGALKFNPKLFDFDDARTEIKLNAENGDVTSRNPRTLPPNDLITPWFTGLNKLTVNPWIAHQTNGIAGGATSTNFNPYINSTRGREFWSSPLFIYNGTGGTTADTATETYVLGTAYGIGRTNNSDDHSQPTVTSWPVTGQIPGGVPFASAVGISSYSQYAKDAKLPGAQYGAYKDKLLTDSSIFNFYDKTLDGPNSFQYQHWSSFNAELTQTFLNDRLGFDLAMYKEHYLYGGENYLTDSNYAISVDINTVMPDGTANPNVGRPYISTDGTYGNGDSNAWREAWRAQMYGSIKSSDFTSNKVVQFIFGEHNVTGIVSNDKIKTVTSQWVRWFASSDWGTTISGNGNQTAQGSGQNVDIMTYIGGSMLNASTASGANLSGLDSVHAPGSNASIRYFDSHWKYSLNPTDPTFVNPNDPYTLPIATAAYGTLPGDDSLKGNQSQNTANYVGWTSKQFAVNNSDSGDKIFISGNTRVVGTESKAFSWQGYMFDRILTPAFGWRSDRVTVAASSAPVDPNHLGYVSRPGLYDEGPVQLIDEQQTRTWSVVAHLPQAIKKNLPLGMDFSVHYNKSTNFQAQSIRRDFLGGSIPDPTGETTEKGFVVSALDGKVSLKVNWYDTLVKDADLPGSSPLGAKSYELYLLPTWAAATATSCWGGLTNTPINGKIADPWFWDYADGDHSTGYGTQPRPAAAATYDAAELGMIKAFADNSLPQSFWDAYKLPVSVAAMQAGDWAHAITDPSFSPAGGGGAGSLQSGSGGTVNGISPSATVDTRSKGVEMELYAQPTKNWNITVNASKDTSTQQNLNKTLIAVINAENKLWNSAAGDLRLWSRGGQTMRSVYQSDIYGPYLTMIAQTGSQVPELRPWRVNAVTSYTFDHSFLKNVSIGGAYRWEQGAILGYHLNPNTQLLDVNQPWKGDAEQNVDLWIGYSMNLIKGIKWQIQLNVRNVGRKAHLIPISVEPDGSTATCRIADGQYWSVTNTFSF